MIQQNPPCEQSLLLSFWARRRKGGSPWIQSSRSPNFWTDNTILFSLLKLVSNLLADKPMVITEPTVPTEQQNTLSNIDFCSALRLLARFPEQRLVPTHIEPSGRLAELLPSPRPHYSARPNRFVSPGPSEDVSVRLGYVTEVNWPRGHGKTPYRDQASETLKRSRLLEQNTNCKNVQYTSYSTA